MLRLYKRPAPPVAKITAAAVNAANSFPKIC